MSEYITVSSSMVDMYNITYIIFMVDSSLIFHFDDLYSITLYITVCQGMVDIHT